MLGQSMSFYSDEFAGRITTKVMQTALSLRETVMKLMDVFVYVIVYFVGTVVLVGRADIWLTLPLAAWLAGYLLILFYFVPRLQRVSMAQSDARAQMTGRIDARHKIVIENVTPELNCGRYAVKREVGAQLEVPADLVRLSVGLEDVDEQHPERERAGALDEGRSDERAQHVKRAVGQIDEVHDAEDEREPGGQEEQQDAELQAVQGLRDQQPGQHGSANRQDPGARARQPFSLIGEQDRARLPQEVQHRLERAIMSNVAAAEKSEQRDARPHASLPDRSDSGGSGSSRSVSGRSIFDRTIIARDRSGHSAGSPSHNMRSAAWRLSRARWTPAAG